MIGFSGASTMHMILNAIELLFSQCKIIMIMLIHVNRIAAYV